jgi:hypothetical protein
MEKLLQVWRLRVAVLCILACLWSFTPLAGAEMAETFCGLEGLMVGMTTAAPDGADGVAVAGLADDVLAMAVTPDARGVTVAEANAVDAIAPLSGILVAGQGPPAVRTRATPAEMHAAAACTAVREDPSGVSVPDPTVRAPVLSALMPVP